MSAGMEVGLLRPVSDLALLAPRFRAAVEAALAECNGAPRELDAVVYETFRSAELQAVYYARGRTVRPPAHPVTHARTNLHSWHGYGLAVDVIHRERRWSAGERWFREVARVFRRHGCRWGGDFANPDLPHFQWGRCRLSPSALARRIVRERGVEGVWERVGAG